MYRSPHNPTGGYDSSARELTQGIVKITEMLSALPSPTPNIILTGDFNLPNTNWPNCCPKPGASNLEKEMINVTHELISQFFLSQMVLEPTHLAGNILDLIFTNNPSLFVDVDTIPTYPNSSHHLVEATTFMACDSHYQSNLPTTSNVFGQYNLFNEDTKWDEISGKLASHDWNLLFHGLSVDEMLELVISKCKDAISAHAPRRRRRERRSKPPRHRRALMRK